MPVNLGLEYVAVHESIRRTGPIGNAHTTCTQRITLNLLADQQEAGYRDNKEEDAATNNPRPCRLALQGIADNVDAL